MKLKPGEVLLLLLVLRMLAGGRGARAGRGKWLPEPGPDALPVVPLPPNPLEPAN